MSKATVLIVEDDGILAMNLQNMLEFMDYKVAGPLASGEEAIAFVPKYPVDLVLMDIDLSGTMNGIAAAETISLTTDIPVVFLTGFSHDPLLAQAKVAAPYGYLIKPVSERELAATLEMALHRHLLHCQLKESRAILEKSEAKYRHLFENSPLGIFRTTLGGKVLALNAEMARIFGSDTAEEVIREFSDLSRRFHVDPERRREFVTLLRKSGSVQHFESEIQQKGGGRLWVSLNAKLTTGDGANGQSGEQIVDGFAIDITERKRAEEEIQRNEDRLRRLVNILQYPAETIQDFLDYVLDQALQLTESAIGYIYHYHEERQELVLNSWSKDVLPACAVLNPQTCSALDATGLWGEAVRQRRPLVINDFQAAHPLKKGYPEGHLRLQNFVTIPIFKGERIVSVVGLANKATDYEESDILQISFLMDAAWKVIDNMRSEEEKQKLAAQLLQAQKMEAIGTLAGGIAHDFNNILGAILGYAEIAGDSIPPESVAVGYLDKVMEASYRAAGLVKQILAFSRQADTVQAPLQPALIIKEAIKILRPSLPSTISIKQQVATATKAIFADPTQVHQILMNLCTNAFHAMEVTGGTLEIALQDCELSTEDVRNHPGVEPGGFVMLSVGDTGTGIPFKIQEKIFDPYFTTKEVGKGTGMGLAIVHGIVSKYGGFITCESTTGKGTVFRIFFPAVESEDSMVTNPVKTIAHGREHILFVDDEQLLVELGTVMLNRLGYEVTARTSSLEALSTFQSYPERFDAVITDQTMPNMTGMDLARRILKIRPEIPIILCTGFSNLVNEKQAKECGIKGFAMKPLTKKEVAAILRTVLDN